MRDESSSPVLYVKLIYSDKTKKILSIFRTKRNKSINPFDYLNQYFNTKVAIIGHFTVVGLVTWPLSGSEAGGDLVLIQSHLLFKCKCKLVSMRTT